MGLGVGDHHSRERRVAHALARHELRALGEIEARPLLLPRAERGRPVALGEAVEVGHVEAHLLHGLDHRRGRRRTARRHLDAMLEAALHALGRVHQHVEHDGRAAQVRHAVLGDRGEDERRVDLAQAHVGAARGGHRPGVGPAAAVEHRQRPQIDRARREPEGERVAERVQVRAAMVVDHALGIARRARGVEERQRIPFVERDRGARTSDRPWRATTRSRWIPAARPMQRADRRCRPRRSGA